jgi:hypothetical protein
MGIIPHRRAAFPGAPTVNVPANDQTRGLLPIQEHWRCMKRSGLAFAFRFTWRLDMFMSSDEVGAARRAVSSGDWFESASPIARQPRGLVPGIDVRRLPEGTVLVVDTHNSRYRIVMTGRGSQATIHGGPYFQEETDVRIEGSALAGSLLKVGWIGVGLFMELASEDKRVVTSRVRSIVVEPGPVATDDAVVGSAA